MATGTGDNRSAPQPLPETIHASTPGSNSSVSAASPPSKRELISWWRKFGRKPEKDDEKATQAPGIFGVPLAESIRYANVAISLTNEQGESFIYGYVPIVVAKCGVFLKEKATDVEGIFRLSGSAKRIKDLQTVFNSPERYGKGLDWTGYIVHDAANILRRYLNQLPEPIVPLDCYEKFRDPLRSYQTRMNNPQEGDSPEFTASEHANAVVAYQKLITELPALNRQLLLYILDLLAVFASKSDLNRMTAANLAAIFQPGIISHPDHDMSPREYRLSQDVLIFLIENQDHFLIGMAGTSVDEQTQKDVESGAPSFKSPKPNIGRSTSNASAGADSLRKFGGIRRNASTSSRTSRGDRTSPNVSSPGTPSTPSYGAATATGSLGRSNTVPSKRSPAIGSHRFQRPADSSIQNSPVATPTVEQEVSITPESDKRESNTAAVRDSNQQRLAPAGPVSAVTRDVPVTSGSIPSQTGESGPASASVPTATSQPARSRERKISNLFSRSPIFGPSPVQLNQQERQPRKLQKRQRLPGSLNESAQSSQASLQNETDFHTPLVSPGLATTNQPDPMSSGSIAAMQSSSTPMPDLMPEPSTKTIPSTQAQSGVVQSLKLPRSPTTSLHSRGSMTDPSDFDSLDDPVARQENRRSRWRLSSATRGVDDAPLAPPPPIGQNPGARKSNSSIGSSNRPRQSFTLEPQTSHAAVTDSSSTGQPSFMAPSSQESADVLFKEAKAAEEEKKSLFGKWRAKIQMSREDKKDKEAERERAKSPQRMTGDNVSSRHSLSAFAQEHLAPRAKSIDKQREETSQIGNEHISAGNPTTQMASAMPSQTEPNRDHAVHSQNVLQDHSPQIGNQIPTGTVSNADQAQHLEGAETYTQATDNKPSQAPTMEAISEERPTTAETQPIPNLKKA